MRNKVIIAEQDRIDDLFDKINLFSSDPEIASHWARYLCITVSGFIEASVREIFHEYTIKRSSLPIVNFVDLRLRRLCQNLEIKNFFELVGYFDDTLRKSIESKLEDDLRAAWDSVVSNRHRIAHGGATPGLTYARMVEYYKRVKSAVEISDNIINT